MGILDKAKDRKGKELKSFGKTTTSLIEKIKKLTVYPAVDDRFFEELLVILLEADVGFQTADKIIENLKKEAHRYVNIKFSFVIELLAEEIVRLYKENEAEGFRFNDEGPNIILMVGVNGTGKTTTIAKLAYLLKQEGKTVLVAAADTFRAAAVQQLESWTAKADVRCISGQNNSDPAAVVVDACRAAKADNYDYLICDTAGRLQNKINLMNELAKIKRVAEKELGEGIVNSFLVIDATTGQNGISQAQVFLDNCDINGIILTKIDGTSKGGIILAIKDQLNIDVKYLGNGESLNDLIPFDIDDFVSALLKGIENE